MSFLSKVWIGDVREILSGILADKSDVFAVVDDTAIQQHLWFKEDVSFVQLGCDTSHRISEDHKTYDTAASIIRTLLREDTATVGRWESCGGSASEGPWAMAWRPRRQPITQGRARKRMPTGSATKRPAPSPCSIVFGAVLGMGPPWRFRRKLP
jgi:hypothetical protein